MSSSRYCSFAVGCVIGEAPVSKSLFGQPPTRTAAELTKRRLFADRDQPATQARLIQVFRDCPGRQAQLMERCDKTTAVSSQRSPLTHRTLNLQSPARAGNHACRMCA